MRGEIRNVTHILATEVMKDPFMPIVEFVFSLLFTVTLVLTEFTYNIDKLAVTIQHVEIKRHNDNFGLIEPTK